MIMAQKPDAAEIVTLVDALKQAPWIGPARRWWPDYLFHFTDIRNAVRVLEYGLLVSRADALVSGGMASDNASPAVIDQTDERWKHHVRFYFRPRTPTQFRNEGFRPMNERPLGAHCPVPVYFIFESRPLLTHPESQFSEGSLARPGVEPNGSAEAFRKIPFELVYHDSPYSPDDRERIVFHRHAEVVIPRNVDLVHLHRIWCRSTAEYQTLLTLLSPATRERWQGRIGTGGRSNLFFRRWTFVEDVAMSRESVTFRFNVSTLTPGPFSALAVIEERATGYCYQARAENLLADKAWHINLRHLSSPGSYQVTLTLDDHVAYSGEYDDIEAPF